MRKPLLAGLLTAVVLAAAAPVVRPITAQEQGWINVTGSLAHKLSECGNLTVVSPVPGSNMLIAGVALRGLWANTGGPTWSHLGDGEGSDRITARPTAIVYDPDNPAIFWVSGIYANYGVYKTTDAGKTFRQLGTVTHNDSISVDFSDPERLTLLAGAHERGHTVNLSLDGGRTWKNVGETLPPDSGASTYPFVINAQTFLVNSEGAVGGSGGIYRSIDAGGSWQQVSTYGPTAGALRASNGTLYWAANGRMLRSTNLGLTWTAFGNNLTKFRPVELPDGRIVAIGPTNFVISSDGGVNWTPFGSRLPYTPDGFVYSPERKAFFIWRGDCGDKVLRDAVMQFDFDFSASAIPTAK